ncbi:MAG: hypothetical protein RIQ81_2637 [Pseudomonadota bacterium]|jgi:hypothetical protein
MFFTTALAASIVCTSLLPMSGDPHSWETVTRISIDETNSKAELKKWGFRAMEAWGVEDIETLLTDDRLREPAKTFELEDVIHFHGPKKRTFELYSVDNTWAWTIQGVLRVDAEKGQFEVEYDYKTFTKEMNCKWAK